MSTGSHIPAGRTRQAAPSRTNHPAVASAGTSPLVSQMLGLQRAVGNKAVIELIRPRLAGETTGQPTDDPTPYSDMGLSNAPRARSELASRTNRALQRQPAATPTASPSRTDLDAAYQAAVAAHNWSEAAVRLNGFDDADIAARVSALSPADRDAVRAATPDWAFRVRSALLDASFQTAIAGAAWDQAALLLNAFNDPDIALRVSRLNPSQLLALRKAAASGGQDRITRAVDAYALIAPQSATASTDTGNAYTSTMALFPNGVIISKDVHFIQSGTFAAGAFDALTARLIAAVTSYLSGKFKVKIASAGGHPEPGDGVYPITVQVVNDASATYPMTLHGGAHGRSGVAQAGGDIYELGQASETSVDDATLGHESSHMILGASDEYANAAVAGRVVSNDHSLMGNFYTQGIAAAQIKARHFKLLVTAIQGRYPTRTVSIVR
jgi:hypothetical protein